MYLALAGQATTEKVAIIWKNFILDPSRTVKIAQGQIVEAHKTKELEIEGNGTELQYSRSNTETTQKNWHKTLSPFIHNIKLSCWDHVKIVRCEDVHRRGL